jgi:hypothetical protein
VQLDRESTDAEKDSRTSINDDFVAECSSAENSIRTPAPSGTSRSSAQRRTRPRSGKRPVEEEAVIETKRKKRDLMQSMDNGREDWDTTYHFLMSLRKPLNRLPEDRHVPPHEDSRDDEVRFYLVRQLHNYKLKQRNATGFGLFVPRPSACSLPDQIKRTCSKYTTE